MPTQMIKLNTVDANIGCMIHLSVDNPRNSNWGVKDQPACVTIALNSRVQFTWCYLRNQLG